MPVILPLVPLSTIGKKVVKHQYLLHMSPQYGELRRTSGWDRSGSLGHPCKFQRVSRPRSVTARHSSIGRQPHFAALKRGRHLYSAGRLSRWALAHISSHSCFAVLRLIRQRAAFLNSSSLVQFCCIVVKFEEINSKSKKVCVSQELCWSALYCMQINIVTMLTILSVFRWQLVVTECGSWTFF